MTTTTEGGRPDQPKPPAAFRVGAGIFLSRIAGFLRDALTASFFGVSGLADVWVAALRTPNLIQNLFGEGTLSASMIPVYVEFLEEGRTEDAGRFAGAVLGLVSVAAWGLALVGMLLAPAIAYGLYPEFTGAQQELLIHLLRILFPMIALLVMSAWALGILNSHRRFFVSYLAPVFWNLSMITVLLGLGGYAGWHAAGRSVDLLVALAWGAFVGGGLQLLVQLPWVVPALDHFRLSVSTRVNGMREAIRNFVPVVSARGVLSLSGWIDTILAALLTTGAVSALFYAQRLYLLPISLFAMSIAASELPELSRMRGEGSSALAERVSQSLTRMAFFVIPSAVAFLVFGDLLVAALFERGEFSRSAVALVYVVLGAYALGLYAASGSRVLSSAYYAVRDTRTPAMIAVARVMLSIAIGVSLMFTLDSVAIGDKRLGALGLAVGATIASWFEYGLLRYRLAAVARFHGPRAGHLVKILGAALAAGAVGWGAKAMLGSIYPARDGWLTVALTGTPWLVAPVLAGVVGALFGVTYLALTRALGVGVLAERKP